MAIVLAACGGGSNPGSAGSTTTSVAVSTSTASASTTTTAPGTQQVGFDPYSARGTISPEVNLVQKVTGTCVSPGVAGTTSYRCFAHGSSMIYDPCFAPPHATTGPLVCVADPTVDDDVEFDVGALPAAPSGAPSTRPWAMQLSDGQVCVLVNAAWGDLGPFACLSPGATNPVADCHAPQPATPWWSAACQVQESTSSPFSSFQIDKVWN